MKSVEYDLLIWKKKSAVVALTLRLPWHENKTKTCGNRKSELMLYPPIHLYLEQQDFPSLFNLYKLHLSPLFLSTIWEADHN